MILVILLSLVLVAIVFDILRVHAFKTKCFRIKDSTTMDTDGEMITFYTGQRLHKLFRFTWWAISEAQDRYSNGSVFRSRESAETYIKSKVFNSTKHLNISEPKCYDR